MRARRATREADLVDVLDRVLDKGIVIDAWAMISLAAVDLLGVEARMVVASTKTHLSYALPAGTARTPLPLPQLAKSYKSSPVRSNIKIVGRA